MDALGFLRTQALRSADLDDALPCPPRFSPLGCGGVQVSEDLQAVGLAVPSCFAKPCKAAASRMAAKRRRGLSTRERARGRGTGGRGLTGNEFGAARPSARPIKSLIAGIIFAENASARRAAHPVPGGDVSPALSRKYLMRPLGPLLWHFPPVGAAGRGAQLP